MKRWRKATAHAFVSVTKKIKKNQGMKKDSEKQIMYVKNHDSSKKQTGPKNISRNRLLRL